MGTIFFAALGHLGFVTALQHCLIVELATTPVLLALISTLPSRARESEANTAGVAAGAAVATS